MRLVLKAKIIIGAFFTSCIVLSLPVIAGQAQPVYSLKNLGEQTSGDGKTFIKVQVKCNVHNQLRYIYQASGSKQWCVRSKRKDCFDDRIGAATLACIMDVPAGGAEQVIAPSPQLTAEQQRQITDRKKLEAELLSAEQKKIELQDRQLQLRKRELELLKERGE